MSDHTAYTPASKPWSNASSRLYGASHIRLGEPNFVGDYNFQTSSVTRGNYNFIGSEREDRAPERFNNAKFDGYNLKANIEGSDPLVTIAPDIDWTIDVKMSKTSKYLHLTGSVTGKNFPAYEAFIENANGQRVFITTVMAGENGSRLELGLELLDPSSYDHHEATNMFIGIDKDGNFNGSVYTDGQSFTIDGWNEQNLQKSAAKDFDSEDRMNNKQ